MICFPTTVTMVIRTEYRGQRYSMGSSDPLPAGFEIRFGSLNFQSMGNDYLMRITNRAELHPWRSTGPGPVPITPIVGVSVPTLPGAAGPSAPRRRRHSGQLTPGASGTATGCMRSDTTRHIPRHNNADGRVPPRDL
jgi:hypothetical protein